MLISLKTYLKGKSREEFAKQIGTTKNYVNLLAANFRRPSPDLARRIEIATDGAVSRDELLFPELYNNMPDNTQPQQKQG